MDTNIHTDALDQIRELTYRGLYLQAYTVAAPYGPLQTWTGRAKIVAGELARRLGAPRLGSALLLRAWRAMPDDSEARYHAGHAIGGIRGSWDAWRFFCDYGPTEDATPDLKARAFAVQAQFAGKLRDFARGHELIARAEGLVGSPGWLHIARSHLLRMEDKYEEALQAARTGLALDATDPSLVIAAVRSMVDAGSVDEAITWLEETAERTESGELLSALGNLEAMEGHYERALAAFDQAEAFSPLLEPVLRQELAARRSDTYYQLGDIDEAIRFARLSKSPFHATIAERLERNREEAQRVCLGVEHVQQHERTCAPATLAAISRFWGREADHLEIAAVICYDGTRSDSERNWTESHGWRVREFTVTWDAAVTLLDRGIPFTLTLVVPGESHMQAMVGYDGRRGTLLVRDPSHRSVGEFLADELLQSQKIYGPRAMALVPVDRATVLEGIDFPESELWEESYRIHSALARHDRALARDNYAKLDASHPDHVVTLFARRALGRYDSDPAIEIRFAESMLERFPDKPIFLLGKLGALAVQGRHNEILEEIAALNINRQSHPLLQLFVACELSRDARRHDEARRILRHVLRLDCQDPTCFRTLADLEWGEDRRDRALELLRLASCQDEFDESLAGRYFEVACCIDRADEALTFLEARWQQHRNQSRLPLLTLCEALMHLGRSTRVRELLEQALRDYPEDGELLLAGARHYCHTGDAERASELLAASEGLVHRAQWLRTSAALAGLNGEPTRALEMWREVLQTEPMAEDANANIADLLAVTRGPRAAVEHLEGVCARFPHNLPLRRLLVQRLRGSDDVATERVLREMIGISSIDSWPRLQLAAALADLGQIEEGLEELQQARLLLRPEPVVPMVEAHIHERAGRLVRAAAALRESIEMSSDLDDEAVRRLLALPLTSEQKLEQLGFLRSQAKPRPGNGALLYHELATSLVEPEALLDQLRVLLDARPDVTQCWSAVLAQLARMDRLDEAHELAIRFTEEFRLDVVSWHQLALIRARLADTDGEREALNQALRVDPDFVEGYRRLARLEGKEGHLDEALQLAQQAIDAAPNDAESHLCLARFLWETGDRQGAMATLEGALQRQPDYSDGWEILADWAGQIGDYGRAVAMVRRLAEERAGESRWWLLLARFLTREGTADQRLDAVNRALELEPRDVEAHDLRVSFLSDAGRYQEALKACRPAEFEDEPPLHLQAREAWVEVARGNPQLGMDRMQALVDKNPGFVWGLLNLALWWRAEGNPKKYLEAAQHLADAAPDAPDCLVLLGEACLLSRREDEARSAFRRALDIQPDNEGAGQQLFELELRNNSPEGASRVLSRIGGYLAPAVYQTMAVRLDVARRDEQEALRRLSLLLTTEGPDENLLGESVSRAWEVWRVSVNRLIDEILETPSAQPIVGELWVRSLIADRQWRACCHRLDRLALDSPVTRRAILTLLDCMAETKATSRLRKYIRKHRQLLEDDTRLWAAALAALAAVRRWRWLVQWAGDWREREGLESWMLYNVALGLRNRGQVEEAKQANMRGLGLAQDAASPRHAAWMALELALDGDAEVAGALLRSIPANAIDDGMKFLVGLTQALLAALSDDGGSEHGRQVHDLVYDARAAMPEYSKQRAYRDADRRCARRLRALRGGRLSWIHPTV